MGGKLAWLGAVLCLLLVGCGGKAETNAARRENARTLAPTPTPWGKVVHPAFAARDGQIIQVMADRDRVEILIQCQSSTTAYMSLAAQTIRTVGAGLGGDLAGAKDIIFVLDDEYGGWLGDIVYARKTLVSLPAGRDIDVLSAARVSEWSYRGLAEVRQFCVVKQGANMPFCAGRMR